MEKSPSQILQEARALVAAGWCQGPFTLVRADGQRCHCAAGALMRALDSCPSAWVLHDIRTDRAAGGAAPVALRALDAAAVRLSGGRQPTAIAYNEESGRTQAEVLSLYDEALTEVTK